MELSNRNDDSLLLSFGGSLLRDRRRFHTNALAVPSQSSARSSAPDDRGVSLLAGLSSRSAWRLFTPR